MKIINQDTGAEWALTLRYFGGSNLNKDCIPDLMEGEFSRCQLSELDGVPMMPADELAHSAAWWLCEVNAVNGGRDGNVLVALTDEQRERGEGWSFEWGPEPARNGYSLRSVWGRPTNSAYNPDTANNGGGYWQYDGGAVIDVLGKLVAVDVWDCSMGDFGSWWGAEIEADGYRWHINTGSYDNAELSYDEVDDVYASMSGVLGIYAADMVRDVRRAVNTIAWRHMA